MRVCVCQFVYLCVYVGVNSHACYIWIVNDITHCNTYLFFVSVFLFFYSILE